MLESAMEVFSRFCLQIGCHGNVPWSIRKKEGQIYDLQWNIYNLEKNFVKISFVNPELIGLKGIVKK